MQCTQVVQIIGHDHESTVYPESIVYSYYQYLGHVYACYTNGVFTADGDHNDHPVYMKERSMADQIFTTGSRGYVVKLKSLGAGTSLT